MNCLPSVTVLLVIASLATSAKLSGRRAYDGILSKRESCTPTDTPYEPISGPEGPCGTLCYCVNSEVVCSSQVACGPVMCVDYVFDDDECCEVCENGENCNIDGSIVPYGEQVRTETPIGDAVQVKVCECGASAFDEPACTVTVEFPEFH